MYASAQSLDFLARTKNPSFPNQKHVIYHPGFTYTGSAQSPWAFSRWEGFTRSFIMAGPWLNQSNDGKFVFNEQEFDVAEFYKKGILVGTDKNHVELWGDIADFSQILVECVSLSWSLYISRKHIWDKLSETEKNRLPVTFINAQKLSIIRTTGFCLML